MVVARKGLPRDGRGTLDVKGAVMAAALLELDDVGPGRASVRAIARRVGISHQAISHYFPDRASLFTAMAVHGFRELERRGVAALDAVGTQAPAGAAVAALGDVYVRFARTNRSRFGLMFGTRLTNAADSDLNEAQARCWAIYAGAVIEAAADGWGMNIPVEELTAAAWATVHGLVVLEDALHGVLPLAGGIESILDRVSTALA